MFRSDKMILQNNSNTIRINFNEANLAKITESKTKINQRENLKNSNKKNIYESRTYKLLVKKNSIPTQKKN